MLFGTGVEVRSRDKQGSEVQGLGLQYISSRVRTFPTKILVAEILGWDNAKTQLRIINHTLLSLREIHTYSYVLYSTYGFHSEAHYGDGKEEKR